LHLHIGSYSADSRLALAGFDMVNLPSLPGEILSITDTGALEKAARFSPKVRQNHKPRQIPPNFTSAEQMHPICCAPPGSVPCARSPDAVESGDAMAQQKHLHTLSLC
jgi:hypothetical protein